MPNSISKTEQVCILLDDIDARIEVTAKLHKSFASCQRRSPELASLIERGGIETGDANMLRLKH